MPTHQPPPQQPHLWDGTPMAAMQYVISNGNDTPEHRVYEGMMMSEHTQGKLELEEVANDTGHIKHLCPVDSEGMSILTVVEHEGVKFAATYHDADARRIVAAWNACTGMSTEDLEEMRLCSGYAKKIESLIEQRDRLSAINAELLEALKVVQTHLEAIVASDWRKWEELATPEEFERWVKSRANHMAVLAGAAISKAQGEQL